jgi:hypothetical protein
MKLDEINADIAMAITKHEVTTPQHINFDNFNSGKADIMLKNIWEIENNPIFSSGGGSVGDERENT